MKLLLVLLISTGAFAEFRVNEFENYCAGGCEFKEQSDCESWLQKAHPLKSLSLCQDVTAEVAAKKAKKDSDELSLESIRTKLSDGSAKIEDIVEYLKIKEGL